MRRFLLCALTASSLFAIALPATAEVQREVTLSSVASSAHLEYSWLGQERAVQLSGFGIVLVFRPGVNLYEVNDRVESTSIAPRYASNNEVYVSSALAGHIVSLSRQAQQRVAAAERAMEAAQAQAASAMAFTGAITLNVEQLKGAEAVLINGVAPPTAPVLITMLGLISSDLPNVLLSRHDLQAGPDGKFQAILPIGPDYVRGSYVRVLATSVPGVTSASAQILIDPANAGLTVPFEQQPGGIW